jgi:hypothetical protein
MDGLNKIIFSSLIKNNVELINYQRGGKTDPKGGTMNEFKTMVSTPYK